MWAGGTGRTSPTSTTSGTPTSPSTRRRGYWRYWSVAGYAMASSSTWVAVAACGRGSCSDAGYDVFGIDISEAMIELARRRAPEAEFQGGVAVRGRDPTLRGGHGDKRGPQLPFRPRERGEGTGSRLPARPRAPWLLAASSSSTCSVRGRCRPVRGRRVSGWGRTGRCSPSGRRITSGARWSGVSSVSGRWGSTTGGSTRSIACGCTTVGDGRGARTGRLPGRTMRSYGDLPLEEGHTAFVARRGTA